MGNHTFMRLDHVSYAVSHHEHARLQFPSRTNVLATPADGATLPAAKFVHADLTWGAVPNATGYLLEVEESVDGTWMPILRKVVKEPKAVLEIEPTGGTGTYRWRVRGVLGRRGGRASAWATVVVR